MIERMIKVLGLMRKLFGKTSREMNWMMHFLGMDVRRT